MTTTTLTSTGATRLLGATTGWTQGTSVPATGVRGAALIPTTDLFFVKAPHSVGPRPLAPPG